MRCLQFRELFPERGEMPPHRIGSQLNKGGQLCALALPLLAQALEALLGGIGCRTLQHVQIGLGLAEHAGREQQPELVGRGGIGKQAFDL